MNFSSDGTITYGILEKHRNLETLYALVLAVIMYRGEL